MNKNYALKIFLLLSGIFIIGWLLLNDSTYQSTDDHASHNDTHADEEYTKGPQGGRLLQEEGFALEITLFEKGVPPEFHLYSYYENELVNPAEVSASIKLRRLDGQVDEFSFTPQSNFLRGDGIVTEPHSFDVSVHARYQDKDYKWEYPNYEGRVQIEPAIADESGIRVETAQAATIKKVINFTGQVQIDPDRISEVRARFPGVVKKNYKELGDTVKRGDVLARIQSNESLQNYEVIAPINGVIVQRDIQNGETTSQAPLFVITDLTKLWAELDIFSKDIRHVRTGQQASLSTLDGAHYEGNIAWLSPMLSHASQSIQARVIIDNAAGEFRPGQYIRGAVTIADIPVELAVRKSAIQSFRDFQVVFARINDTYEVRMLELGQADSQWVEVRAGLKPGTEYVVDNSFLIKADIEKSGASHDH